MKNFQSLWIGLAAIALAATSCNKDPETNGGDPLATGNGQLTITVKPSGQGSRALVDGLGTLTGNILSFENTISNFSVYVFNYDTGMFEKGVTATPGATSVVVTGLNTATPKRIVVFANGANLSNSSIPVFTAGDDYATAMQSAYLDMRDQAFDSDNLLTMIGGVIGAGDRTLFMTGEYDGASHGGIPQAYTIVEGGPNNVEIRVERVVAKVELGNISFENGVTLGDLLQFRLDGASVQRVAGTSAITPYPGDITGNNPAVYYGGYSFKTDGDGATVPASISSGLAELGDASGLLNNMLVGVVNALASVPALSPLSALISSITAGGVNVDNVSDLLDQILALEVPVVGTGILDLVDNVSVDVLGGVVGNVLTAADMGGFWYVLPNDAPGAGESTLLTLKGTFQGTPYFYPIEVNGPSSNVSTDAGSGATLNDYIKRNTIYRLDISFKGSLVGSDDSDSTQKLENITVNIVPVDWYGTVDQEAQW